MLFDEAAYSEIGFFVEKYTLNCSHCCFSNVYFSDFKYVNWTHKVNNSFDLLKAKMAFFIL